MSKLPVLDEVLEAAEKLDDAAMAELARILTKRSVARARQKLIDAVEESRREYQAGLSKPVTGEELMREALG